MNRWCSDVEWIDRLMGGRKGWVLDRSVCDPCVVGCIVLYLLSVPAHPYKAEAIEYRTRHTTNLL
jgi:hypothetical protein